MITLALIGVGKWGKNYLTTAEGLEDVQIKFICARNASSLEGFSDQYQKLTSVSELCKNSDIDGVIVATPPDSHFSIVKELIAKGLNVLVEKPLTLDSKQAEELVELSKTSKSKVIVGHIFLFNPAYKVVKDLLKEIGQLKEIIFEGLGALTRDDYSVVWDWGPHPISICLDLLGQEPKNYDIKVLERTTNDLISSAEINLGFELDITAKIKINWQPSPKVRKLQLIGDKGTIVLDDTNQEGQKIALSLADQPTSYSEYSSQSPLEAELRAFTDLITNNQPINSDLEFGLKVVKILAAIDSTSGGQIQPH